MPDVLVRGLDVPKNCATCNRDLAAAVNCIYTQRLVLPTEHDMNAGRHPACPLIRINSVESPDDLVPIKPEVRSVAGGLDLLICPACGNILGNCVMSLAARHKNRCYRCGQAIDWSDWEPGNSTIREEGGSDA